MLRPQRARWEMRFACGGEDALQVLEEFSCDVIVTDMRMPGMDGARLLEVVRNRFPGAVRIILSGHCEMESTMRAVPVAHQFLQKPCDSGSLVHSLERACELTSTLQGTPVRSIVGAVGELPCLPGTSVALMRELEDPDVPVSRIGQIVEQDVAIAAKVMQLVNSAFFGRSQGISSIQHAVTFLGVDVLKQLVVAAEIFRAFRPVREMEGFSLTQIQHHSHRVAAIVAVLPLPAAMVPVATVAALLHDVGKLVLASRLPDSCDQVLALAASDHIPLHEAELQVIGASHAEIGGYLLDLWGLPAVVVSAVTRHHRPAMEAGDNPSFGAPSAIYFANLLANVHAPDHSSFNLPDLDQEYLRAVGMENRFEAWRELCQTVESP